MDKDADSGLPSPHLTSPLPSPLLPSPLLSSSLLFSLSPLFHSIALFFFQGIGNTFQGAANCIMFVLCTQPVRARLVNLFCCRGQSRSQGAESQRNGGADISSRAEDNGNHRWLDED